MKRSFRAAALAVATSMVVATGLPASASIEDEGLWYFEWDRVQDVHDSGVTGEGVTIAVIDSPVNLELPTLADADVRPQDPVCVDKEGNGLPSTSTDYDLAFHGTGALSYLVGSGQGYPGQTGVKGIAPGATVLTFPTRVEDQDRDCSGSTVQYEQFDFGVLEPPEEMDVFQEVGASMLAAIDAGADIITVSVGLMETTVMQYAVIEALRQGVIVVAAVPNSAGVGDQPASLNGVVSVNSITQNEETEFSKLTDVVAAGDNLLFQGDDGDWERQRLASGTSYAAPIVAGNLALAMQKHPEATPNQLIQSLIHNTGDQPHDLSFDPTYGYGLVITDFFVNQDPTIYPDVNPLVSDLDSLWPMVDQVWEGAAVAAESKWDVERPWPIYTPVPVAPSPSPSAAVEVEPDSSPTAIAQPSADSDSGLPVLLIVIGVLVLAAIAVATAFIVIRSSRRAGGSHGA